MMQWTKISSTCPQCKVEIVSVIKRRRKVAHIIEPAQLTKAHFNEAPTAEDYEEEPAPLIAIGDFIKVLGEDNDGASQNWYCTVVQLPDDWTNNELIVTWFDICTAPAGLRDPRYSCPTYKLLDWQDHIPPSSYLSHATFIELYSYESTYEKKSWFVMQSDWGALPNTVKESLKRVYRIQNH